VLADPLESASATTPSRIGASGYRPPEGARASPRPLSASSLSDSDTSLEPDNRASTDSPRARKANRRATGKRSRSRSMDSLQLGSRSSSHDSSHGSHASVHDDDDSSRGSRASADDKHEHHNVEPRPDPVSTSTVVFDNADGRGGCNSRERRRVERAIAREANADADTSDRREAVARAADSAFDSRQLALAAMHRRRRHRATVSAIADTFDPAGRHPVLYRLPHDACELYTRVRLSIRRIDVHARIIPAPVVGATQPPLHQSSIAWARPCSRTLLPTQTCSPPCSRSTPTSSPSHPRQKTTACMRAQPAIPMTAIVRAGEEAIVTIATTAMTSALAAPRDDRHTHTRDDNRRRPGSPSADKRSRRGARLPGTLTARVLDRDLGICSLITRPAYPTPAPEASAAWLLRVASHCCPRDTLHRSCGPETKHTPFIAKSAPPYASTPGIHAPIMQVQRVYAMRRAVEPEPPPPSSYIWEAQASPLAEDSTLSTSHFANMGWALSPPGAYPTITFPDGRTVSLRQDYHTATGALSAYIDFVTTVPATRGGCLRLMDIEDPSNPGSSQRAELTSFRLVPDSEVSRLCPRDYRASTNAPIARDPQQGYRARRRLQRSLAPVAAPPTADLRASADRGTPTGDNQPHAAAQREYRWRSRGCRGIAGWLTTLTCANPPFASKPDG
jgi:hypothetical protein